MFKSPIVDNDYHQINEEYGGQNMEIDDSDNDSNNYIK